MNTYKLTAVTSFGIESILANELKQLGFGPLQTENGRVSFEGSARDIVRCNLWLRCADRVLINIGSFPVHDFEELYQAVLAVNWGDIIPVSGRIHVTGKSVKSKLHSVSHCQSITKKAIIESMKKKYHLNMFPEDGVTFKIDVSIVKDLATITLDTSGPGLHKRGYRLQRGTAPLRETIVAAMLYISRWDSSRPLVDPLCGSGTIPIEAALMARKIAPGLHRNFAAEEWGFIEHGLWEEEKNKAKESILNIELDIYASDNNFREFNKARENAANAVVAHNIQFERKDLKEFSSKKSYGCIITNPPYGDRLGSDDEVMSLYKDMGTVFSALSNWSYFIISGFEQFEKYFGKKASKNRKLYNGKIKTYLYHYFGELPKKVKE